MFHIMMDMDDNKRQRVDFDVSQFSHEDMECAEALLMLKSSSPLPLQLVPSSSQQPQNSLVNHNHNHKREKETEQPDSSSSSTKSVIRLPKPKLDDELPSMESILGKFGERDAIYGVKYLLVNHNLSASDVNPIQVRLAIPNQEEEFLREDEKAILEEKYFNLKENRWRNGSIDVRVRGCINEKEYKLKLSKWDYDSKKGFKYSLIGGWRHFRADNGFVAYDLVTVAVIRSKEDGQLCFRICGGRPPALAASIPLAIHGAQKRKNRKPTSGDHAVVIPKRKKQKSSASGDPGVVVAKHKKAKSAPVAIAVGAPGAPVVGDSVGAPAPFSAAVGAPAPNPAAPVSVAVGTSTPTPSPLLRWNKRVPRNERPRSVADWRFHRPGASDWKYPFDVSKPNFIRSTC